MHEVLVNRLGGLSLSRKSVVRLTDRPDMTLEVHRGRKTTIQQQQYSTPTNRDFVPTWADTLLRCMLSLFLHDINNFPGLITLVPPPRFSNTVVTHHVLQLRLGADSWFGKKYWTCILMGTEPTIFA